jgi:hypothetical protein
MSTGDDDSDNPKPPARPVLPRYLSQGDKSAPSEAPAARKLPAYTDPAVRRVAKSKGHEERAARSYGGRRLSASGAAPFGRRDRNTAGADVSSDLLLMQHKSTERNSLSIQRDWLYEVSVEAARRSKYPALVILFEAETRVDNEWVAVPRKVFQMLLANQPGPTKDVP